MDTNVNNIGPVSKNRSSGQCVSVRIRVTVLETLACIAFVHDVTNDCDDGVQVGAASAENNQGVHVCGPMCSRLEALNDT